MAKCDICGKGVTFGIKVSHSHRRSNRTWKPNVRRVKAMVDGSPKDIHASTRCFRSGQGPRAIERPLNTVTQRLFRFPGQLFCLPGRLSYAKKDSPLFPRGVLFVFLIPAQRERFPSCSQVYSDSCRRGRPIRSAMA